MGSSLPLSRIMHTGFLLECGPDTPIAEAAARMSRQGVSSILIRSAAGIIGIWTEHDALAVDFTDPGHFRKPIKTVMSSPVLTLPANMDVHEAATRLRESGKRHALVVDQDGEPAGIVSQTDLALNQGLEPYLRLREVRAVIPGIPLVVDGTRPVSEIATQMRARHADAVVVDCGEEELGIVTERDMVRLIARRITDTPVAEVATRPLLVVHEDAPLIHARDLLLEHRIRHLAVVDDQHQVTGLIGFRDMLAGAEHMYLDDLRQALEQRDKALARSRNSLRLAERVIESSYEGIMITDRQARIEFVNPAFTFLTGYEQQEVVGKTPAILSSGRHDREFYRRMWATVAEHGFWRGEVWNRRKNGELFLERLTITAITDDQGEVTHYAGLFTDITQSWQKEEHIRQLAYYDPLTGIPNRRLLEDRLAHAIRHAHRKQQMLAVMFLDLDHFKAVNDTCGHATGDELLVQFTRRVQECLREDDTLARLGGDEFIVLLPEVDTLDDVHRISRRLLARTGTPFRINDRDIHLGMSVGISMYPADGTTVEELLNRADVAMYHSKRDGRNRYRLFDTDTDTAPAS